MSPESREPIRERQDRAAYYNTLAQSVFFPVYPVIAQQILDRTGIFRGSCLDVGAGPGHLALSLATFSDLTVYAMDNSEEMNAIARNNILQYHLRDRVRAVFGDAIRIPFPAESMDLVVSRGSIFFWKNLSRGFSECLRILRPGGCAYLGNGFGNDRIRQEIHAKMQERDPSWEEKQRSRSQEYNSARFTSALVMAGIRIYEIFDDDTGYWILFRKPEK